jgi:hypothetical protein
MSTRFAYALSLSARLLSAACGTAIASTSLLSLPGCLSQCHEWADVMALTREQAPGEATLRGVLVATSGTIAVGDGGTLIVREGETWAAQASGTTADLRAVAARPVGDIVLAVGAGGTVVRRESGAVTWEVIDTGVEAELRAVVFVDNQVAVAVGEGVVLRTEDSGLTWAPVTLPVDAPELRAVATRGVEGGIEVLAVGDGGAALISVDGGLTWQETDIAGAADLRAVARTIVFDTPGWVVAAADGRVMRGYLGEMEEVAVVDPSELAGLSPEAEWLVGAEGAVRKVDHGFDGKQSYALGATDPARARLLAVAGLDSATALAVGEGGAIVRVQMTKKQTGSHVCRTDIVEGRPFVVDDEVRTAAVVGRDDWCEAIAVEAVPAATRARLAEAWARDGAYEHASVASFARFVLELLAVGAPPELVLAGQAALADEVRHARACFGLASAYAGTPVGPGPLAVEGSLAGPCDLAALAGATAVEGCINETIAALVASTAAELADDPAVRSRLTAIAADERRHAALAWRTVAWALGRGDAAVREAVARAFACAPTVDDDAGEDGLEAHGRLSRRARVAVARVAWRDIIAPQAAALLRASEVPVAVAYA